MKNVKKIITALLIVLGLLIAAAPYTFAAVCPVGEKVMKCHWSARIELFLGIEIAVLAIIQLPLPLFHSVTNISRCILYSYQEAHHAFRCR